jgi:predicted HicB family RNase H-like nuclease
MSFDPTPRPALKRASDATAHPTAPVAQPTGKAEKTAKLKIQVPKSVKAALQDEAKSVGISVDALVTRILRSR